MGKRELTYSPDSSEDPGAPQDHSRRKPDLFIVGAPRSGTTALFEYLRDHPDIFMCPIKEPNYFSFDMNRPRAANSEEEYLRLFEGASEAVVGEASVWYLYSKVAIPEIMRFNPRAKIIAIVRNPIDWYRSWHAHRFNRLQEDEPDLELAWRKQEARSNGRDIPQHCKEPELLQYREAALFGDQIERALHFVPADQLMIIVYDDFAADTRQVYENALSFLNLPYNGRTDFPIVHETKQYRSLKIAGGMMRPSLPVKVLFKALRLLRLETGTKQTIRAWNETPGYGQEPRPEFRQELAEAFRCDVEKLERVLKRDLGHWLR